VSREPLYETYAAELAALMGEAAFGVLREHCNLRRQSGVIAVHPASRR
jgi:hypothetical protein